MATSSETSTNSTHKVSLRLPADIRLLIDRAAATSGKNRTEFMIYAARREAEAVLLDQRLFLLNEKEHEDFEAFLAQSPSDNPQLKRLLETPAPWDQ